MNPADKFMIFFGLLDLFYDNPLDFGPIINPQFFFLYMGYFDSVISGPNSTPKQWHNPQSLTNHNFSAL